MPTPAPHSRSRSAILRSIGFGAAVVLGAIGIWLIVTGADSPRRIEIGVLTGLWGLLLGAFCAFGSRRAASRDDHHVDGPARAAESDAGAAVSEERFELAVRKSRDIERAEQAAERRAFEAHLQELLRAEIGAAVSHEVAQLRAEIAQLRSELLEKVGGELRLERIETTRLIGSDLEAMRDEVRRLKLLAGENAELGELSGPVRADVTATAPLNSTLASLRRIVEQEEQAAAPAGPPAAIPPATPAPPEPPRIIVPSAGPQSRPPEPPAPPRVAPPAPQVPSQDSAQAPQSPAQRATEPTPARAEDPFADLPRLTPFTDFPLDPVEPAQQDGDRGYAGRRRRRDEQEAGAEVDKDAGRRHRRAEEGSDDVLARLLAREGVRR